MPQIFHRGGNVIAHVTLAGTAVVVFGGFWAACLLYDSPHFNRVGMARPQPVQFSHKHHVGDDVIDYLISADYLTRG